ncbi:MAG: Gmad2 immunoglobulin-like domain-containing protein [Patescibacteria group bacterium]
MQNKNIIISILVLLALALGFFLFFKKADAPGVSEIKSFADCAKAGYPVMESYPRQCKTPDGRTFAEEIMPKITYANASADLITVETPTPGAVTGKTFSVIGKARGTWFFEASFPVELRDKDGNILIQTPAQAQSDWMTTEFVPFKVDLKVPESYIGPATLVLKKDNPSGLPEHEAFILFPITIEY